MKTEHISGFQDRKIEVSYEGDFDTEMLFVLIPGYDYNLDHPLFYYLRQFLKDKRLNHLSFHFNWSRQKELFSQPGEQVFKSLIAVGNDMVCIDHKGGN